MIIGSKKLNLYDKELSMKMFNVTLLAALISAPVIADTTENDWDVGIFADYIKSASSKETNTYTDWQQIEAGKGLGLDLQKIMNDSWNIRVELAATRYDINDGNDTDNGFRYGVDAVYKVEDTGVYIFAGVRRFNNTKNYNALDAGLGYSFDINDRFSLYSEAAAYRDVNNGETDLGFKLGFKYAFGGTSKAIPAVVAAPIVAAVVEEKVIMPLDSDNDGVIDSQDKCANTPVGHQVDSEGCTLFTDVDATINLNVEFANASSIIDGNYLSNIERLATYLQKYPETNAVIEGHSSAVGNAKFNLMLSQQRADAVKNMLVDTYGIDVERLSSKGFGETQLLSIENTQAAHEHNRRVVATIVGNNKKSLTD